MAEDNPPTPGISHGLAKLHLHAEAKNVSNTPGNNNSSPPPSAINNAMIQTPSKNGQHASQFDRELEEEINNLPSSQTSPNNPFKGLINRVSPAKKVGEKNLEKSTIDLHTSLVISNSENKRKRDELSPESSNSSISVQIAPNNPATRNDKHVSFQLQENNNANETTEPEIPLKLNTSVDDFDPARDYIVIPEAERNWQLSLEELRSAARDHSRLQRLLASKKSSKPDLWMLGLAPVPEHLVPLPATISTLITECADQILDATIQHIKARLSKSQKQADRHLAHTKQDYADAGDPQYDVAEKRLLGITKHYRLREKEIQARIALDEDAQRPTDAASTINMLAKRRIPTQNQEIRARKRNRSRSRSRSKGGNRFTSGSGPNSNRRPQSKAPKRNPNYRGGYNPRGGYTPRGGYNNRDTYNPPQGRGGYRRRTTPPPQAQVRPDIDEQDVYRWFAQRQADQERGNQPGPSNRY